MKKINKKILIITCIVCLLPIAIGLAYRSELPDRVVIHFDAKNNPDKYATRNQFIYGIPVIMMVLQIICCVISDLRSKNNDKEIMPTFKWIIPVLTITMYVITLAYALAKKLDIRRIAMIILSVILLVIGNYIPQNTGKIKKGKNKKTNKIPSIVLIIDGILSVMTILTDDIRYSIAVVIVVVAEIIILAVYAITSVKKKRAKPVTRTSSKVINSSVKVEVKTTTKPAEKESEKKKTNPKAKAKKSTNKKK